MVRVIHITDSMLRTAAAAREMNAINVETAECVRRVRAAVVYRNLPWYKRATLAIDAWISHS